MLKDIPALSQSETRREIRAAGARSEADSLALLAPLAALPPVAEAAVWQRAHELVEQIRQHQRGQGGIDALLQEYSLSSEEGVALMCLAEVLLRIPDEETQDRMISDRLSGGDWSSHLGHSESLFVNASAWGLLLTGKVTRLSTRRGRNVLERSVSRLGEPVIRAAMRYAMQIMGSQFVMGVTIKDALVRARNLEKTGYTYSYDMLGEGARTMADADRYLAHYRQAVGAIGAAARNRNEKPGISVKLSALHPRYELREHQRVMDELVPRLMELVLAARDNDIPLTVDAEESWRLDLSLSVIEAVFRDPRLAGYEGFGMAIQAYQKQGHAVVRWAIALAEETGRRFCVRLVKGAYWDTEIKWAQERGYDSYPVFTEKCATDVSYQACARLLMQHREQVYPQFATHNAYTLACVLAYEQESGQPGGYEFQRLHGMGEELYDDLVKTGVACRIYAPVGEHEDLLAYLVRRLLENGANTSFVNNIQNRQIPVSRLLEDPVRQVRRQTFRIPLPGDLYEPHRRNSRGTNLNDQQQLEQLRDAISRVNTRDFSPAGATLAVENPAVPADSPGLIAFDDQAAMVAKLDRVVHGQSAWAAREPTDRAAALLAFADRIETAQHEYVALCIREAGKTLDDAIAEVREAVDFCRYYAREALGIGDGRPLGTMLCISPWNFPLAIFTGQVTAALVTGNTVLAKPAEQTSLIALRAVRDLYESGVPGDALQLVVAEGAPVSEHLVSDPRVDGVMFTGSNATAKVIAGVLARRQADPVRLIAETGGMNAMIVDSTALAEQVVDDVMVSAFHSAGQRCSATRILYLQEDVADTMIEKIVGRMKELRVGDPASYATDVGPVIDARALARLQTHLRYLEGNGARFLMRCPVPGTGYFLGPVLVEIDSINLLKEEVFGPVLHVRRFRARDLKAVIDEINATGFGLTLGVHSRIESRADQIARLARVGNVYVNRNMVGAVVGVQPFGGRGKSGTGPKAGGPHYLQRLLKPTLAARDSADEPVTNRQFDIPVGTAPSVSQEAAAAWASMNMNERLRQVRLLLLDLLQLNPQWRDHGFAENALARFAGLAAWVEDQVDDMGRPATRLPSPTGERDTLFLEPHGVVCVLAPTPTLDALMLAMGALLAGNTLVVTGETWQQTTDVMAGQYLTFSDCLDLNLDAYALADGTLYQWLHDRLLASREDLVPVIFEPATMLDFYWEKTVAINTTAAGGNASLMAGNAR